MAKITDRGSAKPHDPIYSSGLVIGGKRLGGAEPKPTRSGDDVKGGTGNSGTGGILGNKPLTIRHASDEDYRTRQNWTVGTFHRMEPESPSAPVNLEKGTEGEQ